MNPYVKEFAVPTHTDGSAEFSQTADAGYYEQQQYEYGDQFEQDSQPLSWSEIRRMYDDEGHPVTALAYDTEEELLWAGYGNGRISSFTQQGGLKYTSVKGHPGLSREAAAAQTAAAAAAGNRSSKQAAQTFAAGAGAAVTSLQVFGEGVISVSSTACRLHTRGCLLRASFEGSVVLPGVRGAPGTETRLTGFTCAALNKASLALGPGIDSTTHVTVACTSNGQEVPRLYQLDIYGGLLVSKAVDLPAGGAGTAMACGAMLAVGCEDGCIRLYDAALRSRRAEGCFELHTGSVTALAATVSDGGLRLASVGQQAKSLNPFDKNAPHTLRPDSVVRTFDLRMMRQSNSMQCGHVAAAAAPVALTFLPNAMGCDALAVTLTTGQLLLSPDPFSDLDGNTGGVWLEYYQLADAEGTPETVTAIAAGSSGDVMAVGTASSAALQLTRINIENPEEEPKVNANSRPTHIPQYPPLPPLRSIHPMDKRAPAGAYIINPTARHYYQSGPLSSTLAHTPWIAEAVMKIQPRREIAPGVLASMTKQEFLGTVPNPGYLPNSLLHGTGRCMYAVSDPRGESGEDGVLPLQGAGGGKGSKSSKQLKRSSEHHQHHNDTAVRREQAPRKDIPERYRPVSVQLGRRGYDAFDFGAFNSTEYAGLENGAPNAYTNAVLQLLYHVPPIKAASLWEQYNPAAHLSSGVSGAGTGLTCELGLFFSRLDIARAYPAKTRTCQSTNFLLSLKQVHDIASLNLLEGGPNAPLPLPLRIEAFHRFLLYRLHKELSAGPGAAAVDALYGHDVRTVNKFVNQQQQRKLTAEEKAAAEDSKLTRNFILEMAAPADAAAGASSSNKPEKQQQGSSSGKFFSDALLRSLTREARTQAWSPETGNYAPIIQTRTLTSLPAMLAIHCSPLTGADVSSHVTTTATSSSTSQPSSLSPVSPLTAPAAAASTTAAAIASSSSHVSPFRGDNCRGGPWLPEEFSIHLPGTGAGSDTAATSTAAGSSSSSGLAVSERADRPLDRGGGGGAGDTDAVWYTTGQGAGAPVPEGVRYKLFAVVSHVTAAKMRSSSSSSSSNGHLVLHVREPRKKKPVRLPVPAAAVAAAVDAEAAQQVAPQLGAAVTPDTATGEAVVLTEPVTPEAATASTTAASTTAAGSGASVLPFGAITDSTAAAAADTAVEAAAGIDGSTAAAISSDAVADAAAPDNSAVAADAAIAAAAAAAAAAAGPAAIGVDALTIDVFDTEAVDEGIAADATTAAADNSSAAASATSGDSVDSAAAAASDSVTDSQSEPVHAAESEPTVTPAPQVSMVDEPESDTPWLMFNDILVEKTVLEDARGFKVAWKEPCILLYQDVSTNNRVPLQLYQEPPPSMAIDPSIFNAPSLSKNGPAQPLMTPEKLPRRGSIVAIDAEFVALEIEEARLRSDGSRVVTREGRQGLARVSALNSRAEIILDDYVLQTEGVVDHLTRFSGITPQDLDPFTSRHSLVPLRVAYLKLRCLVDRGCILLGHGLAKDLRVMNLAVPPTQVLDTSDLWSLPGQRKVSLRFLSFYVLKKRIQEQTHDSIIDSQTTLGLYTKYKEIAAQGPEAIQLVLKDLYRAGYAMEWKVRDRGAEDGDQSPIRTTSITPTNT